MTAFQGIFIGFLIGSVATMFCVWLAGGSLCGSPNEMDDMGDTDGKKQH